MQADEASHRGVNHTLWNLDQTSDPNPFIEEHANVSPMHLAAVKPAGLEREEVLEEYARRRETYIQSMSQQEETSGSLEDMM
jgi:translation elongation factor EF-Ts